MSKRHPTDFELAPFRQQMLTDVPELAQLEHWERQALETWQWIVRSPHKANFQVELFQTSPGLIVVLVDETYDWEPREMPDPDAVEVLTALARGRVRVLQLKYGIRDWRTFTWVVVDLNGAQHCYPEVPARLSTAVKSARVLTDSRPSYLG